MSKQKKNVVDEEELEDLELMDDILQSIDVYERDPATNLNLKKSTAKVKKEPNCEESDSSAKLSQTLALLGQALEYANALQNMLLMKEVKLLSMKRRLTAQKEKEATAYRNVSVKEDDVKCDIGRFIVRFKAPYFKDDRDFAAYVVVPEKSLPTTSTKYEDRAVEWTKPDLQELERLVKKTLAANSFQNLIATTKLSTYEEKKKAVDKYNYMKDKARLSDLIDSDFDRVIDWCNIASNMRKYHSPHECQKAWNIYLQPSINKKKWSQKEKEKLGKLALEYNYEDWDAIAKELDTSRSGYQCFHQHQDIMNRVAEGEWTKGEEELLKLIVHDCTYGSKILWTKVSYYFEFRSLTQIYRKWTMSNFRMNHKVGAFSKEDDEVILNAMLNDTNNFSWVAHRLNRTPKQIRYRFTQLKNSLTTKYGAWTLEEDEQLLTLVETYGVKKWAKIAQFIPNRKRVQIRHRYVHLKKHLDRNPQTQLEQLKRNKRTVYQERKLNTVQCVVKWAKRNDDKSSDINETLDHLLIEGNNVQHLCDDAKARLAVKRPRGRPPKNQSRRKFKINLNEDKTDKAPNCSKIVSFFRDTSKYAGEPIKPLNSYDGTDDLKAANGLLKFEPYKYFDPENAEWWFTMDKSDPYYVEASKIAEQLGSTSGGSRKCKDMVLPPSLPTFEALHNLLVDIGFNETDLQRDDLNEQMSQLYEGQDSETRAAVDVWKNRIKTLFFWPAVLSEIDLEERENEEVEESSSLVVSDDGTCKPSTSVAASALAEEAIARDGKEEIGLSIHVGDKSERVAKLMMHEDNGVIFIKAEEPLDSSFETTDVFDLKDILVTQDDI